ncbi:unnamed protein product, partial [Closterium sp. NIES-64]
IPPKKKRRKLEAERQAQEEEAEAQEFGLDEASDGKPKAGGKTRADLAYRKAKAIKSAERLRAAGKIVSLAQGGRPGSWEETEAENAVQEAVRQTEGHHVAFR